MKCIREHFAHDGSVLMKLSCGTVAVSVVVCDISITRLNRSHPS